MGWQWLEGDTTVLDMRSAEASASLPHHNREFGQAIEGH
jgi:hypothetical protein